MRLWIAAFLAVAVFHVVHAEDFYLEAPVITAKLYNQSAELVREAKVTVHKNGKHRIIISPLLSDNIANVSLEIEGARLIGQSMRPLPREDASEPLVRKADEAEQALILTRQSIEDNRHMSLALTQRLQGKGSSINDVQRQLDSLARVREKLLKMEREQQDALKKIQEELGWQNKGRDKQQYAGVFDIYSDRISEVRLTLREQTDKAFWQPYSEFSLNTTNSELDIRAYAQIEQHSGLDWENTEISLSFAPQDYQEQPLLQSTTVAAADRAVATLIGDNNAPFAANHMMSTKGSPAIIAAREPEKIEAGAGSSDIVISGVDFSAKVPGKHSIASSGDRYQLTYWQNRSHAKIYSATYTWVEGKPLLAAEWQLPDGYGFFPGNASFFRDGNRIGHLRLARAMEAGSRQIMSFGEDPAIEISYAIPPDYNFSNRFLLKDRIEKRQIVTLRNTGKTDRDVRLYARLPIATQTEVRVEAKFSPDPNQENVENVKGIVLWEKKLRPGETLTVGNNYDIFYPEGKRLIGVD
ncbi:MAG: mucoidy inhibitor MuiA family protein [Cardiobacteriaceae bacterium]|nr:mucoidy inhibitor MuiA family protein [Cardiobacteriaceae bacterium]